MRKRGRFEAPPQVSVGKRQRRKDPLLQMLVSSGVSLLLCFSMFLSTTMAWFSDTVISAGNQITIGTLKVDVLSGGQSLKENHVPLFTPENGVWAPGKTVIRELTIRNKGDLDIWYDLGFVLSEGRYEVADYFQVYVKEMAHDEKITDVKIEQMTPFSISERDVSLKEIIANGYNVISGELQANAAKNAESRYAIAIRMQDQPVSVSADDVDIQGETLTLNIKLVAQQVTAESRTPVTFAGRSVVETTETTEETETAETTEATQVTEATEAAAPTETTSVTEPPETTAATEPPETTAATEPPETTAATEPPETTAATEPPETTAATEPPESRVAAEPPETTESTEPPVTTQPPEDDGTA